jgi:hypothetical protein
MTISNWLLRAQNLIPWIRLDKLDVAQSRTNDRRNARAQHIFESFTGFYVLEYSQGRHEISLIS